MIYKCSHCEATFEWAESTTEKVTHYCKNGEMGVATIKRQDT